MLLGIIYAVRVYSKIKTTKCGLRQIAEVFPKSRRWNVDWEILQGRVEDLDNPSYFWRAHTVTVLLGLIGCLVYTSLIGNYFTSGHHWHLIKTIWPIASWNANRSKNRSPLSHYTQKPQWKTPATMEKGALQLLSSSGSHWVKSRFWDQIFWATLGWTEVHKTFVFCLQIPLLLGSPWGPNSFLQNLARHDHHARWTLPQATPSTLEVQIHTYSSPLIQEDQITIP